MHVVLNTPHGRLRRLREQAGYATAADFARVSGLEEGTYRSHENGSRGIRFRTAMTYVQALNARAPDQVAVWILDGGPEPELGMPSAPAVVTAFEDDFALIADYDIRAGAGGGAVFDEENMIERLAFRRQWLRRITNAPLDKLGVIQAHGDSMEPTLHSGDHLLVDRADTNPRRDGIYVISWDGAINVKRVTVDYASKTLSVSSDNPLHPTNQGVHPDALTVLGRVVWIGRRL